jgi:hypothetical protein
MSSHIRTWQVIALQLMISGSAALCLAVALHYPDVGVRPEPAPGTLFLMLIGFVTFGVLAVSAAGGRSAKANTAVVIASTIAVWILGSSALVFNWIDSYGT